MSEGDLLKIKLQLLQFQTDVSAAKLAKLQALAALRQFLGFESVPDDYDVQGALDYQPVHADMSDLKTLAASNRPDLRAAQQAVTAAESQLALQQANGKMDVTGTFNYTHTNGTNSGAFYYNMPSAHLQSESGRNRRERATPSPKLRSSPAKPPNKFPPTLSTPTRICTPTIKSFSCIRAATSNRPSNRATSANMPTDMAPPACSIFWTRSAPTAPTSLPIARLSPAICSLSNRCAKP